jgi:hypothetical protein
MSRFFLTILVFAGVVWSSHASGVLPTPEDLLASAGQGPAGYVEALKSVSDNVALIDAEEKLIPYVLLLDKLETIGAGYDLRSFPGQPLDELAAVLTRRGLGWTDMAKNSLEYLLAYVKWADNETTDLFIDRQNALLLERMAPPAELVQTFSKGVAIRSVMLQTETRADVVSRFEYTLEVIAERYLEIGGLSLEEKLEFVAGVVFPSTIKGLLKFLSDKAYAAADNPTLREIYLLLVQLKKNMSSLPVPLPSYLEKMPGDTILATCPAYLHRQGPSLGDDISALICVFNEAQTRNLIFLVADINVCDTHADHRSFLSKMGDILLGMARDQGWVKERRAMERFISKFSVCGLYELSDIVGTYDVTLVPDDRYAPVYESVRMTIVNMNREEIAVAIRTNSIYYTYWNVSYDSQRNIFEAQRFLPESPTSISPLLNYSLTFKVDPSSGIIAGVFEDNHGNNYHLKGRRIGEYWQSPKGSDRMEHAEILDRMRAMDGTYTGTMAVSGHAQRIKLVVKTSSSRMCASLIIGDNLLRIEFNYASIDAAGFVILTSAEQPNRSFIQLRILARKQYDDICAIQYIVGGDGVFQPDLTVKRKRQETI